jgi:ABC-type phosphate/phosphonate transport system substrate-binding protein
LWGDAPVSFWVAALPMYDWPEARAEVDGEWAALRGRLRNAGIDAPEKLARRNADLPPAPGGIRNAEGQVIAPDPATLPPDDLHLAALWRHPRLLLAQTCWGPMEEGLSDHVVVVGQPDYSAYRGGAGDFYSSAILMRRGQSEPVVTGRLPSGETGNKAAAQFPLRKLCGKRFAFNAPDSMSGYIALSRDLEATGESLALFSDLVETGAHRASIRAVAEGRADACAVDCRSWALALAFEPAASELDVVGWTRKRLGLPFIASRHLPSGMVEALREALQPSRRASSG